MRARTIFICQALKELGFGSGKDAIAKWMIILTTKPVPKNRKNDPFLADKFIVEKEKIFCWMFDDPWRLIRNNFRLTISEKTKRSISEIMSDKCNITNFFEDRSYISFGSEYSESTKAFYSAYVD